MISHTRIRELLDQGAFEDLFIGELGWDNPTNRSAVRSISADGTVVEAVPVATKRGVTLFHAKAGVARDRLGSLDRELARRSSERLLVVTDPVGSVQQWFWPEPRRSGGVRYVAHPYTPGIGNSGLVQRVAMVAFSLDEEPVLTVLKVRERVRAQFHAEAITQRFYKEFETHQKELMGAIKGIDRATDRSWYSSLLLNRLMFIYFMQRKQFLNEDADYLRSSLTAVQALRGHDRFYQYYRDFLLPLFHDGLGSDSLQVAAAPEIVKIIGSVPYINGGIFAVHTLEAEHEISVPDSVFESIFTFFDRYRWHLDERGTKPDQGEINPEVLGYIFEQYVNQKQMGAYYTREDVTGYMAAGAMLPALVDLLSAKVAPVPAAVLWRLLREDTTGRYVPDGLRYGVEEAIPPDVTDADPGVAGGILDRLAPAEIAIPGERWREVLARRSRLTDLLDLLARGVIQSPDQLVRHNLNVQALLVDWIDGLTNPDDVAVVWHSLVGFKVVDPTCGSGAFLFAALDILDELYESTFDAATTIGPVGRLRSILVEAGRHASVDYYRLKTIVLSNLYGLDIMQEATEIARLRLFLALAARLRGRNEIEPLPDLDLNIKSGNLLVGCPTVADAHVRFGGDLTAVERIGVITDQANRVARCYREFVDAQITGVSATDVSRLKHAYQVGSDLLRDELDLLVSPYERPGQSLDRWRGSHQPFHWFIEFPEVMNAGGFHAVIGNPPYVAKAKINTYRYSGFATDTEPDIFAPCIERAADITRPGGGYAMIVPIAAQFSPRDNQTTRKVLREFLDPIWVSAYSRNPAALFDAGLGVRSTILLARRRTASTPTSGEVWTTGLRRWWHEGRALLFDTNDYVPVPATAGGQPWPRLASPGVVALYAALHTNGGTIGDSATKSGTHRVGFKQTALYYVSVFIDEPPAWDQRGRRTPQTKIGWLGFYTKRERDLAFILLAGRLSTWWWGATGDDFDVTAGGLQSFPVSLHSLGSITKEVAQLATRLRAEQLKHPLVTLYAGKEMGNYDMTRCRAITDEADQLLLSELGLTQFWPAVLHADATLAKVTGERPGTRREWPYPL